MGRRMQLPIQITLRDIPASEALEDTIRKKAEKLDQYYHRITSCRVVIELTQNHKHQGKVYNARIDIKVPGKELVVTHQEHQDLYVALRDAFDAVVRQLEDHASVRQGNVKRHEEMVSGQIARLITQEGYGFIEGDDGNEYYFSITNVAYPKFEQLIIGDDVEFLPTAVSNGLQAHHVIKIKRTNGNGSSKL